MTGHRGRGRKRTSLRDTIESQRRAPVTDPGLGAMAQTLRCGDDPSEATPDSVAAELQARGMAAPGSEAAGATAPALGEESATDRTAAAGGLQHGSVKYNIAIAKGSNRLLKYLFLTSKSSPFRPDSSA